jgi:DNA-binding IclR family transcriptional regulator
VPVVDHAGRVVAALNSSGHSKKLTKAQLVRDRLPVLRQVSEQISRELAHVPALTLSTQA